GLAGAVGTDHADLGTRIEAHGDVIEDDLLADGLAGLVHGVNELCQAVLPGSSTIRSGRTIWERWCSPAVDWGPDQRVRTGRAGTARSGGSGRGRYYRPPHHARRLGAAHGTARRVRTAQSGATPFEARARRAMSAPCSVSSACFSPLRGHRCASMPSSRAAATLSSRSSKKITAEGMDTPPVSWESASSRIS